MISSIHNGITFQGFSPVKVDEKLLRGAAILSINNIKKAKEMGVTQIIDLRNSAEIKSFTEKILCKLFGIKYINYKYPHRLNNIPDRDFFEKINNSITTNNGKTYIHCQYGKRRTSIAVAIYEKECTNKNSKDIISDMLRMGFKELTKGSKISINIKRKKLQKILDDFIIKYYPDYYKTNDLKF